MKSLIITEEEKSRILGMHQSATSRQYLMESTLGGVRSLISEGFKPPGTDIVYKLDFKSVDDFNKFIAQSSVTGENPYAKKLGFLGMQGGSPQFVSNIWSALAYTGRNPSKFAWGNIMMIKNLLNEASTGLNNLPGWLDAKELLSDEKIKIWSQPVNPKNPSYTNWNGFYDMFIKPDITTRAALIAQPTTPQKPGAKQ
jgi:hypothetical protein